MGQGEWGGYACGGEVSVQELYKKKQKDKKCINYVTDKNQNIIF